jgi:hypothetical protein
VRQLPLQIHFSELRRETTHEAEPTDEHLVNNASERGEQKETPRSTNVTVIYRKRGRLKGSKNRLKVPHQVLDIVATSGLGELG